MCPRSLRKALFVVEKIGVVNIRTFEDFGATFTDGQEGCARRVALAAATNSFEAVANGLDYRGGHGLAGFGRGRESLASSIWHWHRRRLPFHDDGSVVVERIFTTSARSCSCRAMEIDEPATSRLTSRTLTRSPTSSYCSGVPASTLARSHFALIASVSQMFSKLNRPDRSWSAIHAMASHRARRARFSLPSFWAARIACANTPRMRWCSGCLDRLDAKVA